jgi:hypothetical protein
MDEKELADFVAFLEWLLENDPARLALVREKLKRMRELRERS